MCAKGRYVPDPDLIDDDGYDLGKEANDCGFDEVAPAAGSADELADFEDLVHAKIKPEDVGDTDAFKARYAAYLKQKGIDPESFKGK